MAGRPKPAAAANAPSPIRTRTPLIAITAVHALCKRMKKRLVRLTNQRVFLSVSTVVTFASTCCLPLSSYLLFRTEMFRSSCNHLRGRTPHRRLRLVEGDGEGLALVVGFAGEVEEAQGAVAVFGGD